MNIDYAELNLRDILMHGHAHMERARALNEQYAGALRAGSAGVVADGEVFGECPRIAHARLKGHDKPVDSARRLMFAAGEGNEDLWEDVLKAAWNGRILRDQRYTRDYEWGKLVGSPDIILAGADGTPNFGLELKLLSAMRSSAIVSIEGRPETKHLIQSAVYMMLTGLPYVLCYTNRTSFQLQFDRKKYGTDRIEPFYRLFYLRLDDGVLAYRDEFNTAEMYPGINLTDVEAYYRMVAEQGAGKLMSRPSRQTDICDPKPLAWNRCDAKYCPLSEVCDQYENDYETWLHAVAQVLTA